MKKILALTLTAALALTACSSVPTPIPARAPTPVLSATPKPSKETTFVTRSSCEVLRVTLETGGYSPAFGGAAGVFVPVQGLSLAIPLELLECRRNGVFVPFEVKL